MNLEIERKFLLKKLPSVEFTGKKDINQCYVWSEEKQDYDRYRQVIDGKFFKYYHTFKKHLRPGVQEEYEEEIDAKTYHHFFLEKSDRFIQKQRNLYKKDDLIWEIDVFLSMSLIVAEIELPKENYDLKIPEEIEKEIIIEVTDFPQFINSNLALKI